tara:strand:- start:433 stop:1368 length:936 start_codon:yes stop_codon:yes gene_type:complete
MKTVLITGGLGFIGSELANYLYGKFNLIIFDNPRNEMINYFSDIPLNLIERDKGIGAIYEINPDIIIHLGAKSNTDLIDPFLAYFNNTSFTNNLINYSIKNNKKLIYASSAATYGDGTNGFQDTHEYKDLSKLRPLNLYGWSKHNSDLYFSNYLNKEPNSTNIIGLKFFNVFGRNEIHKKHMASVISQMIPKIKKGERIKLFKHYHNNIYCEAERDFVFVQDICKIIENLINKDLRSSIYNLGSGKSTKFSTLLDFAYNSLNQKPNYEFIDLPKKFHGKYQMRTLAPVDRLLNILEDFKFSSLEKAIPSLI